MEILTDNKSRTLLEGARIIKSVQMFYIRRPEEINKITNNYGFLSVRTNVFACLYC